MGPDHLEAEVARHMGWEQVRLRRREQGCRPRDAAPPSPARRHRSAYWRRRRAVGPSHVVFVGIFPCYCFRGDVSNLVFSFDVQVSLPKTKKNPFSFSLDAKYGDFHCIPCLLPCLLYFPSFCLLVVHFWYFQWVCFLFTIPLFVAKLND